MVPLLIVDVAELHTFVTDLLEDSGVVMKCLLVIIEVVEPEGRFEGEFVEDERPEVDV